MDAVPLPDPTHLAWPAGTRCMRLQGFVDNGPRLLIADPDSIRASGDPGKRSVDETASDVPETGRPFVVLAPGYGTSVGYGFWPIVAERLVDAGFVVVGCQFSGSGFGDDLETCTELDRFAHNHYGHELDDLEQVRGFVRARDGVDARRGVLIGHSRGGGMAIVHAAESGTWRGVVTWNAMDSILRFSPERLREWRENGGIEVVHWGGRTKVRLGIDVLDAAEAGRVRFDPTAAAGRLACPLLLVQGEDDDVVPVDAGRRLAAAHGGDVGGLHVVSGGDHVFGMSTRRPFLRMRTGAFDEALDVTARFVARVC